MCVWSFIFFLSSLTDLEDSLSLFYHLDLHVTELDLDLRFWGITKRYRLWFFHLPFHFRKSGLTRRLPSLKRALLIDNILANAFLGLKTKSLFKISVLCLGELVASRLSFGVCLR